MNAGVAANRARPENPRHEEHQAEPQQDDGREVQPGDELLEEQGTAEEQQEYAAPREPATAAGPLPGRPLGRGIAVVGALPAAEVVPWSRRSGRAGPDRGAGAGCHVARLAHRGSLAPSRGLPRPRGGIDHSSTRRAIRTAATSARNASMPSAA